MDYHKPGEWLLATQHLRFWAGVARFSEKSDSHLCEAPRSVAEWARVTVTFIYRSRIITTIRVFGCRWLFGRKSRFPLMNNLLFRLFYLFKPPWDTGIPVPELQRALVDRPAGKALDLGCGTGTNVRYLVEHGWQATGIDFVPRAIAKARRKLGSLPATLLAADVTKLTELDLPGPFDLALDVGCFHSLPPQGRQAYILGLQRWLKPGALLSWLLASSARIC